MLNTLYTYGIALTTFLMIDLFWLNIAAKELYRRSIGQYISATPNLGAAGIFYAAYIAVLVYFVINPARADGNFPQALLRAALFGGICYATYDLTNLAVLKDWPLTLSIIDIIWGMVLTMAVTAITLILLQRFGIK
ncbi:MAG: DUF2177 family protein [bacterium]